jgi:hypothetical protein
MTGKNLRQPEFSFPPNEHFDDEWEASLAYAWELEAAGNIPELFRYRRTINNYHNDVHKLGPGYFEQSRKLSDLTALIFRACNSL